MKVKTQTRLASRLEGQREINVKAVRDLLKAADAEDRATTFEEDVRVEQHLERAEVLDRRLKALPKIERVREPDIYERGGPHSYFRDLTAASAPYGVFPDAQAALSRLTRHQEHENRQRLVSDRVARRMAALAGLVVETRADSTTAGTGGEFTPPQWMVKLFASAARGVAPLASLARQVPLPADGMTVWAPRFDVSAGVAVDATENVNPQDFGDDQTDALTSTVATIAGGMTVSQQWWDRAPGVDQIVAAEFGESYGETLEHQLLAGSGSGGQLLGLLHLPTTTVNGVPPAQAVAYADASPTPTKVIQNISNLAALVADVRKRPPSVVLMRGSRYFWLTGSPDGTTDEPVMRPGVGLVPSDSDVGPFGPVAGLPVFVDDAIPTDLGAGTDQDCIVVVRCSDIILLEEAVPHIQAVVDTSGGPSQLTVRILFHKYCAALTSRYPSAIGVLAGSGLVVPSGW